MENKFSREQAAVAGGVLSAMGGAAFLYARRHSQLPKPEILNEDRLPPPVTRQRLNMAAAHILCGKYVSRLDLQQKMDLTKDQVNPLIGYLRDSGLVIRNHGSKKQGVPAHYEATQGLAETLLSIEVYPDLAVAIQQRAALLNPTIENL